MSLESLDQLRLKIGVTARDLRAERRFSQAELARRLRISQATLSLIERGRRSFTAEQLLLLCRIFNVGASHFAPPPTDAEKPLQNALARFGADHLQENEDTLTPEHLEEIHEAIRDALLSGSPRLVAALAPVIVQNIDQLGFPRLRARLADAGFERRLDWLLDNVREAIRRVLATEPRGKHTNRYRRADSVLDVVTEYLAHDRPTTAHRVPDVLDRTIRTRKTIAAVQASSSEPSKRWGIVTRLQIDDFVAALEGAHGRD